MADGVGVADEIGTGIPAVRGNVVAVKTERNSGFRGDNSRPLPAAYDRIRLAIHPGTNALAPSDGEIVDIARHQALGSVTGIDALLRSQVVVVGRRAVADISPALRALGIVEKL